MRCVSNSNDTINFAVGVPGTPASLACVTLTRKVNGFAFDGET
jgi:hypothetical protein